MIDIIDIAIQSGLIEAAMVALGLSPVAVGVITVIRRWRNGILASESLAAQHRRSGVGAATTTENRASAEIDRTANAPSPRDD